MGVYIKGVEMPKDRAVYIAIDNGEVFVKPLGALHWTHLDEHAVEIPPHGRLIDERDIVPDAGYIIADGMACIPVKYIANAPTIIPAEEGE